MKLVEHLFHSALEHPKSEWKVFLDAACDGDEALLHEVESLLACHARADGFIESPALVSAARLWAQNMAEADEDLLGKTISHYRILERLGAGGMGVVYRAQDTSLDRFVALKFLSATETSAGVSDALERLKREARAASAIDHPNICAIHDISEHEGQAFIVMQYLEGQTLRDRMSGRAISLKELLSLGLAVSDALVAAHARGILHRDIKPANIFVTCRSEVKVLDFGIAKLMRDTSDKAQDLAEAGTAVGTAAYMSPEQARGEEVDGRSDIFSLGAVLYEMATGCQAFPGKTNTVIFNALLNHEPARPRLLNPSVPKRLERIIHKALQKERDKRYQTASQLHADLATLQQSLASGNILALRLVAIVCSIALAVAAVWYVVARYSNVKARPSVAVLSFKNLSGQPDEAWLAVALPEMVTTELAEGEKVRTIPEDQVARIQSDLSLPDADHYAKDTLAQVRKILNTNYVVLGSYLSRGQGGKINLNIRLQRAGGETLATVTESGTRSDVTGLVARASAKLRDKLGAGPITTADTRVIQAALPLNPETEKCYAEGLSKLRLFDALGARDAFEKAISMDPTYALVHSGLSSAWSQLGYDAKAQAEAAKAFELAGKLSREDHLWVEGLYHEAKPEWDKAASVYRTLYGFFPDNLEYGLRLADVQISGGKPRDALVTLKELQQVSAADARIELGQARAYGALTEFSKEQSAAATAAQKAEQQGARLLLAQAVYAGASALANQGEVAEAISAYEKSSQAFSLAGNQRGVARCINSIASLADQRGDYARAQQLYEQAGQISRKIRYETGIAASLANLSQLLSTLGDLSQSERFCQDSLVVYRRIEDRRDAAGALIDCGAALQGLGDLRKAKDMYEEAVAAYHEIGGGDAEAFAVDAVGAVLVEQGKLVEGQKKLEQARDLWKASGNRDALAFALFNLGSVAEERGHLTTARQRHEEALAIRRALGEQVTAAVSQVAIADVAIEDGHPEAALTPVRQAIEVFRANKDVDNEIDAELLLAKALLDTRQTSEAGKVIGRARTLAAERQDPRAGLNLNVIAARVEVAAMSSFDSMKVDHAIATLESTVQAARHRGLPTIELEGRLALGEIELACGNTDAGRNQLAKLERDARAAGFLLISKKAGRAASGVSGR